MKALLTYNHTLLYYGPSTKEEVAELMDKEHKTPQVFTPAPAGEEFKEQSVTQNEVLVAPYTAKNIYMMQYTCQGQPWDAKRMPVAQLFSEYYSSGMNSVVFQEIRERRALAYHASARYAMPSRKGHPEYATTFVITQNDKMGDCISAFKQIINNMPQTEAAFALAKQSLQKQLASKRTTKQSIMFKYLNAKRLGIDYDIDATVYNSLPKLSLADIVAFERKTMADKPYRYLILGDESDIDIKTLEKIAPVKRLTTKDIFGY